MDTNIMNKNYDYKYTIDEKLKNLPKEQYKQALIELPKLLNISDRQFQNYRYAKKNSKTNMTADKLHLLSKYFNCTMEDLLNL
jgi:mRNA-degrading endonuclease RelE of RelBE toxin-antitoxin system